PRGLTANHRIMLSIRLRFSDSDGSADDSRHVFRPGAALSFLAPSAELLEKGRAAPHVQHAGALWAAELMRRQAQEVHTESLHIDIQRVGTLNRVRMHGDPPSQRLCPPL